MSRALTLKQQRNQLTTKKTITPNSDLILADCSGSMSSMVTPTMSKLDCLADALVNKDVAILGFADRIGVVTVNSLRHHGLGFGTFLEPALRHALTLQPMHVLIISDGRITGSNERCLELTTQLFTTCEAIVDTLYIGPDDIEAQNFMRELAMCGHGRYSEYDIVSAGQPKMLETKIAGLLAAPSSPTIKL